VVEGCQKLSEKVQQENDYIDRMKQAPYPSDLTDKEWQRLEPLVGRPYRGGRPRKYTLRAILDAIFYVIRTGCQWRALPHDLPQWKTVHHYFRMWRQPGVWIAVTDALRQQVRRALGREAQPSAGIIASQSVKTTGVGGNGAMMGPRRSRAGSAIC
jgi:putative transposase